MIPEVQSELSCPNKKRALVSSTERPFFTFNEPASPRLRPVRPSAALRTRSLPLLHVRLLLRMMLFQLLRLLGVALLHLLLLRFVGLSLLGLLMFLLLLLLHLLMFLILLRSQFLLLLQIFLVRLRIAGVRRSVLMLLHFARVIVGRLARVIRRTPRAPHSPEAHDIRRLLRVPPQPRRGNRSAAP